METWRINELEVDGIEAAAVSYPGFEADLRSLLSGGR